MAAKALTIEQCCAALDTLAKFGNITTAAAALGLPRTTLQHRVYEARAKLDHKVHRTETSIKYVVQAGDIDMAGDWDMQAYVELPTWKGRGAISTLKVRNTI